MLKAYLLGTGYKVNTDGNPILGYPYNVYYTPGHPESDFYLDEGTGHFGNGGFIPPTRLLDPLWHDHFKVTNTLWLLPYLQRLANHEPVPPTEILNAYQQLHNAPPKTEEWPLT